MYAFEANVTVINESSSVLKFGGDEHLDTSTWVVAPTDVPNDGKGYNFRLVSNMPLCELQGGIYYQVPGGEIKLSFNCPVQGDNIYPAQCSAENFGAKGDGDGEGICNITYHVYNK